MDGGINIFCHETPYIFLFYKKFSQPRWLYIDEVAAVLAGPALSTLSLSIDAFLLIWGIALSFPPATCWGLLFTVPHFLVLCSGHLTTLGAISPGEFPRASVTESRGQVAYRSGNVFSVRETGSPKSRRGRGWLLPEAPRGALLPAPRLASARCGQAWRSLVCSCLTPVSLCLRRHVEFSPCPCLCVQIFLIF